MDDAVKKGCHPTAQKHAAFIAQEMLEFSESGYWTILPYSEVRHLPGLIADQPLELTRNTNTDNPHC